LVGLVAASCGQHRAEPAIASTTSIRVPVDARSEAEACLALWAMPGNRMRRPDEPEPGLVVAVWPDGRLVAGRDSLLGGAPYREGRVEPAIVARAR
jgi:hypothetical protein